MSAKMPLTPTKGRESTGADGITATDVSHIEAESFFLFNEVEIESEMSKTFKNDEKYTRWNRFKNWYMGEKGNEGKRYCGSKLSKGPFIFLHVIGVFFLLCLIIVPIITAVVIPNKIQSKFDESIRMNPFNKAKEPTESMPSSFEVLPDGSTANFRFNFTLAPLTSIGGVVELVGPTIFYIADPDGKDWASVTISDTVTFSVSETSKLSMLGNFSVFDKPGQNWIDSIFPQKIIPLVVHTKWTIKFWGFVWYRDLALKSRYDMPIPTTLQEKFDEVVKNPFNSTSTSSNSSSQTTFEYLSTSGPSNFRINTTVANLTVLPGIVEVTGPTTFGIYDVKNKGWANVTVDTVSFPIHRTTRLSIRGNFSIYSLPTPSVITSILTTNEFVMVVKTWWTIKFNGQIWYSKLQLQSQFDMNTDTGTQLWSSVRCRIYTC